ncbi:MAG: sigma-70 family RNA polymerase sigma factor [Phycisphaerales bacterium JB063]
MTQTPAQPDGPERFARLLAQYQQSLLRYILLLTGRLDDAQDILQETSVALLRKIDEYDPERPFMPWARRFAYYEVLRKREQDTRKPDLLAPDVLDRISVEIPGAEPLLDERRDALNGCLGKMTQAQRDLLRQRYDDSASIRSVAEATGQSIQTLYTRLKRLRNALMDCVDRAVRQGDAR